MGNGRTTWYEIENGEHEEDMILNLLYRKDTRKFLDFLLVPSWAELLEAWLALTIG